jgi:hypothetical protein
MPWKDKWKQLQGKMVKRKQLYLNALGNERVKDRLQGSYSTYAGNSHQIVQPW